VFRHYAISVILAALLVLSVSSAYGHGLGFDESIPVLIAGKQVSVEATLKPASIEEAQKTQPVFTVRAHEPNSNATIAGMDYRVMVESKNEVILDQRFRSSDGLVLANLIPDKNAAGAQVNGQPASPDPVDVGQSLPAEIKSKMMSDGGLYHVAVTLENTSTGVQLQENRTFDLYLSVSKLQDFPVETAHGPQTMSVRTYYDEVADFSYDQTAKTISFSMPFNWSLEYVNQVQVLHMEVQFPKSLPDLQVNGYRGILNGQELTSESIQIDDFTYEDKRLVHFVISNTKLVNLADSAKGDKAVFTLSPLEIPKFPIDLFSNSEKYLWQLSWGPEIIRTGAPTTFVMNLQNPTTGDLLRSSSFDFVLTKDGKEVHRQNLSSGLGTFSYQYTFLQPGTYRLAAQNINGEQESAQIDLVVLQGTATTDASSSQPQPSQQPSGCLIATAAFGSELTPQVQFLRGFRDNYILQSSSGSAFMNAFNTVYYSFSPQVADYERQQPWLQTTVKTGLYPLFGILLASEKVFSFAGGGETGTVLAGTTASSLIGAVYVFPAVMAATIAARKRIGNKALLAGLAATVIFLALTAVTLLLNMHTALIVSTSAFVVSAAATAALAMARAVAIVRAR
jgi:hypothetical protein